MAKDSIRHEVLGRSRQADVPGGRPYVYGVRVTAEQKVRLSTLAAEQQVSVPRLMVEAALSGRPQPLTQRREAMAELSAIRGMLSSNAINIDRMAKADDVAGEIRPAAVSFLHEARRLNRRIDEVLERLVRS